MKKVYWIVMKDGDEIYRYGKKNLAEIAVKEIGGYIQKYTEEGPNPLTHPGETQRRR